MKALLIIALLALLFSNPTKPKPNVFAEAKQLDRDIVKLKRDIQASDIMQGSTADFIARVDKMAKESETRRVKR